MALTEEAFSWKGTIETGVSHALQGLHFGGMKSFRYRKNSLSVDRIR